jgi:hypothetical protein
MTYVLIFLSLYNGVRIIDALFSKDYARICFLKTILLVSEPIRSRKGLDVYPEAKECNVIQCNCTSRSLKSLHDSMDTKEEDTSEM